MNIAICIKIVSVDLVDKNTYSDEKFTINPYDLNAIMIGLDWKKRTNAKLTCICMGASSTIPSLRRCLAMGVDEVVLLNDSAFAGSDTFATSYVLAQYFEKNKNYDMILCGEKSVDGETGQVSTNLALRLDLTCITGINCINEIVENECILQRTTKQQDQVVSITTPFLGICRGYTTAEPTISLLKLKKAKNAPIPTLGRLDLECNERKCGLKGSKTKVLDVKTNLVSKASLELQGDQCYQQLHMAILGLEVLT